MKNGIVKKKEKKQTFFRIKQKVRNTHQKGLK